MKFLTTLVTAGILLQTAGCAPSDGKQARQTVTDFYSAQVNLAPQGALSLKGLIAFRPMLSMPLLDIMKDVSLAEEKHIATTPDSEPPLVDGNLLAASRRPVTSFNILACDMEESTGVCAVELADGAPGSPNMNKWTDRVSLVRDNRAWVIDDITYGGDGQALRTGKLRTLLQSILANAG